MKKVLLHTKIHDYIIDYISELKPGSMLPTELDLAKKFKVSRLTVHKVMANLQRDGILRRVKGKGTFVADETKEIIKFGPNKRNGKIIMAFPDWFSEDIFYKVSVAERLANQHKMELINLKLSSQPDYGIISSLIKTHENVKGVILIPPGAEINLKSLKTLDSFNIPIVTLVPVEDYASCDNIYIASSDFFEVGYIDISFLIGKGHRKFAYVANEPWTFSSKQTYAGMKRALQAHGMKQNALIRPSKTISPGEDSMQSGYDFTKEIIKSHKNVTSLIFDSLTGLMGGLRYLNENKILVPEKLSLLSNADYGNFENFIYPSVTTVTVNRDALVSKAFELITEVENLTQKQFLINAKVQERESVKKT